MAARLARLAGIAYLEREDCRRAIAEFGGEATCFDEHEVEHEVECFVAHFEDHQVLVVRGTEPAELRDWLTDVQCARTRWHGPGLVHSGFARAAKLVEECAIEALRPGVPLWLAGHSLGGAAVTGVASSLSYRPEFPIAGGATFGSPRYGNSVFRLWFNEQFPTWWRVVHNNDVVTRLPPRVGGYRHVGSLAYIDSSGRISTDPRIWKLFLDRVRGRVEALVGEPDVLEVPGVDRELAGRLERAGLRGVRRLVEAGAVKALASAGVPAPLAARIVRWALSRTLHGTVFDGVHDHNIEIYARKLEEAADGERR